MHKFQNDELKLFLIAVDRHLSQPCEMLVIGGAAAVLAYGVANATKDIDIWEEIQAQIKPALDAARKETGLNIPVEHPGVQDGPWEFKDRLQRVDMPSLKQLTVKVPERHDLVLMKNVRGEEPDFQIAERIHENRGLDFDILLERYTREMYHVIGAHGRLDTNFLVLIQRLFGEERADQARAQIERIRGSERT